MWGQPLPPAVSGQRGHSILPATSRGATLLAGRVWDTNYTAEHHHSWGAPSPPSPAISRVRGTRGVPASQSQDLGLPVSTAHA